MKLSAGRAEEAHTGRAWEVMSSYLEITCTNCGTGYNAGMNDTDVSILFKCVRCKSFNLYHLGRTVALDTKIMLDGSESAREAHVRERIHARARAALLEAEHALPRILNINVDVAFVPRIDPPELEEALEAFYTDTPSDANDEEEDNSFLERWEPPTAEGPRDGDPISDDEVQGFLSSLDTPEFWNRFKGSSRGDLG